MVIFKALGYEFVCDSTIDIENSELPSASSIAFFPIESRVHLGTYWKPTLSDPNGVLTLLFYAYAFHRCILGSAVDVFGQTYQGIYMPPFPRVSKSYRMRRVLFPL